MTIISRITSKVLYIPSQQYGEQARIGDPQ
jgi:hypothetical protein